MGGPAGQEARPLVAGESSIRSPDRIAVGNTAVPCVSHRPWGRRLGSGSTWLHRRSTNWSAMECCTSSRVPATHTCPALLKMPQTDALEGGVEVGVVEHDVR